MGLVSLANKAIEVLRGLGVILLRNRKMFVGWEECFLPSSGRAAAQGIRCG